MSGTVNPLWQATESVSPRVDDDASVAGSTGSTGSTDSTVRDASRGVGEQKRAGPRRFIPCLLVFHSPPPSSALRLLSLLRHRL